MPCRARFIFIPLIAMISAFGCGGHKSLTETAARYEHGVAKRIRHTVDDEERRDKLLSLEGDVRKLQLEIALLYVDEGKKMRALKAPTEAEIAQWTEDCSAKRKSLLLEIGGRRMEMRSIATKAEWQEIFPNPPKKE